MNRYVMELLGTFVLVFTVTMSTIDPGASPYAPFSIGLALAVMIYAGGHVSGAHYNPAVTVAATLRGACPIRDAAPYIIAQLIGGFLGAFTCLAIKAAPQISMVNAQLVPAVAAELVFTAVLAFVVLRTATVAAVEGNSYYGLAIGGTVTTGAIAAGAVSGGVFNPAVATALFAIGVLPGELLPYLAAQVVAGAIAAALFRLTSATETIVVEIETITETTSGKVVNI